LGFGSGIASIDFLRVSKIERSAFTLTAGVGGAPGPPIIFFPNLDILGNYMNLQIFNAPNASEEFISFQVDGIEIIKDILVDQGSGSQESVTNISFKTEIPKGSELTATVSSTTDLSTVDLIVFISGI